MPPLALTTAVVVEVARARARVVARAGAVVVGGEVAVASEGSDKGGGGQLAVVVE
jgi:hypothetical protein